MPPVFRFAPSPNGYLHLGHALSALLNADMARANSGRLLLRIEDIDTARCRPEYEAAIYEDLAWLGLHWESPIRRQSEHWDNYRSALAQLEAMGLIYPSFESRAEIARLVTDREAQGPWPRDPDGTPLYPGDAKDMSVAERNRRIEAGEPYALRLDMRAAMLRAGTVNWVETGAGPGGATGTVAVDPSYGAMILARKETPHQLSPCGRRRRRRARRDPRGARPRPVSRNRGPPLAPGAAWSGRAALPSSPACSR
jgi:glutamyl-Q tRNA(Asp) synthetase